MNKKEEKNLIESLNWKMENLSEEARNNIINDRIDWSMLELKEREKEKVYQECFESSAKWKMENLSKEVLDRIIDVKVDWSYLDSKE